MMIAQDEFNSANQRRFTLNSKSGPNSIMSMDEQPRRQTQIQKQKKDSVAQHQRISVISKNNIRFNKGLLA